MSLSWVESLLIILGISLDVFASMECQGSLIAKVNKKQLSLICLVASIWQLIAMSLGYFGARLLLQKQNIPDEFLVGECIAVFIFVSLGVRLLVKGLKKDYIQEHLESKIRLPKVVHLVGAISIFTILVGIAFAFYGANMWIVLSMIFTVTILFIIAGVYTGYHFGFEGKRKAYIIGTVLLWAAAVDLVIRLIIMYN